MSRRLTPGETQTHIQQILRKFADQLTSEERQALNNGIRSISIVKWLAPYISKALKDRNKPSE